MHEYPALRRLAQTDGLLGHEARRALDVLDCARVTGWPVNRAEQYLHDLALANLLEPSCRP